MNVLPSVTSIRREQKPRKKIFPESAPYNTLEELNADDGVDLIANVLPHSLHCGPTVASLKAGKHVIVEKPMCVTIAEATEMITTAEEKRRYVVCTSLPPMGC